VAQPVYHGSGKGYGRVEAGMCHERQVSAAVPSGRLNYPRFPEQRLATRSIRPLIDTTEHSHHSNGSDVAGAGTVLEPVYALLPMVEIVAGTCFACLVQNVDLMGVPHNDLLVRSV
jgi:hypothetical protein